MEMLLYGRKKWSGQNLWSNPFPTSLLCYSLSKSFGTLSKNLVQILYSTNLTTSLSTSASIWRSPFFFPFSKKNTPLNHQNPGQLLFFFGTILHSGIGIMTSLFCWSNWLPRFGRDFDQSLDGLVLPNCLRHLQFGREFNQSSMAKVEF